MSPRPYQLGKRQDVIDDSRQRMVSAARDLLAEASRYTEFTVNAVAERADVARATVYYQFGSKTGLLEALCDSLATSGHMTDLPTAFAISEPIASLRAFVRTFAGFWAADPAVMRRLRALAALDPEVHEVIAKRDQWRRAGLENLVSRLGRAHLLRVKREEAVRLLHTLTSFEVFEGLAANGQSPDQVAADVLGLAQCIFAPAVEAQRSP